MKILAIETSCDETGLALVEAKPATDAPKFKVIQSLVSSQIKIHRPYGGVVPNLAKREHLKNLPILYKKLAGKQSETAFWKNIDLIAVTVGPGLEPALWAGINFAKSLSKQWNKPLVGANHMEGHLYSFLLPRKAGTKARRLKLKQHFPAIALIVSGGHTMLLNMKNLTTWKLLGETRDDAAGEAFDKVARLLGFPYPGGPEIEKVSRYGDPQAIPFPRPMIYDNSPAGKYYFSFSGLKTSVLYYMRDHKDANVMNVAASFQKAAIDVLVHKTIKATKEFNAKSIILAGGVAANKPLRKALGTQAKKAGVAYFVPEFQYNTDNAAMIAAAGYFTALRKKRYKLQAEGNLGI